MAYLEKTDVNKNSVDIILNDIEYNAESHRTHLSRPIEMFQSYVYCHFLADT